MMIDRSDGETHIEVSALNEAVESCVLGSEVFRKLREPQLIQSRVYRTILLISLINEGVDAIE